MKKLFAILTAVMLLSFPAFAQIHISGPLSGILEDTTYIVDGDISVEEGDSLIIEAGAVLLFDGEFSFDIDGYLYAVGNENDSIKFTLQFWATYWKGIDFSETSSDSSILKYCSITASKENGIHCIESNPTISHCNISWNWAYEIEPYAFYGGGIYCEHSSPLIEHCYISNNCAGVGGGICFHNSYSYVMNCTIISNSADEGGGLATVLDVYYPSDYINIYNCLIKNNYAEHSGGGIDI